MQHFTEEHRLHLEEKGYVVVPNVITEELADETISNFQAFNAESTGQDFNHYDRALELKNVHGIIEFPGSLSHVDFVEKIRHDAGVTGVFASIYGVNPSEDPIRFSYDRVNYQASETMRGLTTRARKSWWHVDQHYSEPNFSCVQGYVDLVGSETDQHAGLMVISESHLKFADLALAHIAGAVEEKTNWDRDWHRLTDEELTYCMQQGGEIVNVKCPKGGMVLWDSRTVHMSRPNHHPNDERLVIYTCGWPESRLSEEDKSRRSEARKKRRATSHWPDARHLFPVKPQWFGERSMEPEQVATNWIMDSESE